MTNQRNAELIRTAVGAVRAPFAIADMQIVRFRGQRSRIRVVPQTALVLIDTVVAKVLPVEDESPRETSYGAATPQPAEPVEVAHPEPETDTETAPESTTEPETEPTHDTDPETEPETAPLDEERKEQLEADRKAREHKATRSNKSLSSIAQDLAVAEAVANVHEDNARKEELTAKDFGPKGSS